MLALRRLSDGIYLHVTSKSGVYLGVMFQFMTFALAIFIFVLRTEKFSYPIATIKNVFHTLYLYNCNA